MYITCVSVYDWCAARRLICGQYFLLSEVDRWWRGATGDGVLAVHTRRDGHGSAVQDMTSREMRPICCIIRFF